MRGSVHVVPASPRQRRPRGVIQRERVQRGVEADAVVREVARFRQAQHRQQHARLVRARPAAGAIDVQGAEGAEVAGEGHGARCPWGTNWLTDA